ncbi:LysR family transcriptional regulator [Actinosynnema sp. NPDC047251]|uniref:HTH lysR-type domain-containing protein n=1 Tax=Saccharothrix espanaensis (strain ATCC 51144 / DSM 44229 / JCM 9112 / NBRC 15066 / NRRL 15764) TaxID=1179773 RepID=K0K7B3_SACES|nr:LysR family transcriptional regulator [Saccharothrix espanaensis]CCH32784.1 hypothetical protein BN6_55250 [Saccharothrix espanaensis DSM 44229]
MAELGLGSVRAFVAVADNRHFGEAAAQLGTTQQAVSKGIAKLEATIDSVLLSRLRAGTGLSRAGEVLLPHTRALLATADHALTVLSGRLVVGLLDTGPRRHSQLRRDLLSISQRMLSLPLRNRERDGLVTRAVTPAMPPRVDYGLIEAGRAPAGRCGRRWRGPRSTGTTWPPSRARS